MLPKNLMSFDGLNHSYTDKFGAKYDSVSSVLNCVKKAFPKEAIARNYARKHNLKVDDVLLKWEENSQLACCWGTEVHDMLEQFVKNGLIPARNSMPAKMKIFEDVYKLHRDGTFPTRNFVTEQIVFSPEQLIAGTADLINIYDDGITIDIYDYKTGKKMKERAMDGKKLLPPLNHIEDCKLNQYAIQMSIYGKMFELWGYKVNSINVIWFQNTMEDYLKYWNGSYETHLINIPYMKSDVELLFKYRKDKAKNEGMWTEHPKLEKLNNIINEHHRHLLSVQNNKA